MRRAEALRLVGEYAADQWGLVTSAQAKKLGVDGVTLARLVDAGLLDRVAHGVYGVPAAMTANHQAERAAWLRLAADRPGWEREPLDPDGGVISHRSAAAVHDVGDLVADAVEITVPRRRTTRDPGVRLRTARLSADEVTRVDGLPVTTVERTIVDLLADRVDGGHVGDILATAHRRHLVDLSALAARVARFAPAYGVRGGGSDRGARLLARLLDHGGHDVDVVREEHDRQVSTVVRQLATLDTDRLHIVSQLLRSIGPDPEAVRAAALPGLTELMQSIGRSKDLEQWARQIGVPAGELLANSEPMRQLGANMAQRLRPILAAALPEESRSRLAEGLGLLAAVQMAGFLSASSRSDEDSDDEGSYNGTGNGAIDGSGDADAVEDP